MALVSWSPFSSQAPPERLIASARKTFLGLWRRSRAGWEIISLPLTKIMVEFVFLFFLFLLKSLGFLLKAEKRKKKKKRDPDWGSSMCFWNNCPLTQPVKCWVSEGDRTVLAGRRSGTGLGEMPHLAKLGQLLLTKKAPPTEILSALVSGASKCHFSPFHHHGRTQGQGVYRCTHTFGWVAGQPTNNLLQAITKTWQGEQIANTFSGP